MNQLEIEIKSLLGSKENADNLIEQIKNNDPECKIIDQSEQLNHYFLADGNFEILKTVLEDHINEEQKKQLENIITHGKKHSVRTRESNGKVIFVIKASADETTSENGTARLEFEATIDNLTIDQLDQILLDCGFTYQSKWSRSRKEYKYKDYVVCIDKNAGYGYLTEFEKIINDKDLINKTKKEIRDEMEALGIKELNQDRLARMFEYYNKNWPEYYGTEKTFNIE